MNRKSKTPKRVQDAADIILEFLDGCKTTDDEAIQLALAIDKEKCNRLSCAFRNAEMRYVTRQVRGKPEHKDYKRKTFKELLFL